MNKKYKSVEFLDKELQQIAEFRHTLKDIFDALAEKMNKEDYSSIETKEYYQKAQKFYYLFFNSLESMCAKIQYGVIDIKYFENQVGENINIYAEAQILYVKILEKLSEKLGMPFASGQNRDTFRNFYQLVASRQTEAECLNLNEKRREVGLPRYNNLTREIEWD